MSEPTEVLSQLLSPAQAATLETTGVESWAAAASALRALQGALPSFSESTAALVMPDEVTKNFADAHLVVPLELSTDQDQAATAYLVLATPIAATYLDSQADNPDDEEQQTIVMASTVIGQVVQALNSQVFARSQSGLVIALDDLTANSMPELLAAMDDPCMLLTGTLGGAKVLPVSLLLPGTFLDILATAMTGASAPVEEQRSAKPAEFAFALTQEDLEAAELLDEVAPQPILATVGGGRSSEPLPPPPPPRQPTPIGPAASRARFAPLPEQDPHGMRQGIDLLAGLHMNVTVELGRTELTLSEVLGLGPGSVVELDRLAGEPVDILVNERLIARGEVVVVDENFGVRVVEVVRRGQDSEDRA